MLSYYKQQMPIRAGKVKLWSELTIPSGADTIIVIPMVLNAFCEGESTISLDRYFQLNGWGTLVVQLLPELEFGGLTVEPDDNLLTERLISVTHWLTGRDMLMHYRIAYYGSDLAARPVMRAAAHFGDRVSAVMARGGRFDHKDDWLERVEAPALLIAGSRDAQALAMNRIAVAKLNSLSQLEIIEGAAHNFSLDKMKRLAEMTSHWLCVHLKASFDCCA